MDEYWIWYFAGIDPLTVEWECEYKDGRPRAFACPRCVEHEHALRVVKELTSWEG